MSPATVSDNRDYEQQLYAAKVRSLFEGAPRSIPFNTVLAIIIGFVVWQEVPPLLVGSWIAAFLLLPAARFVHWFWASRRMNNHDTLRCHNIVYIFGAGLTGLLWGGGLVLFEPYLSTTKLALVLIPMSGICSGAATSMPTSRIAFLAFQTPALVLPAVWLALRGNDENLMIAGLIMVFLIGLVSVYSSTRKVTLAALSLQIEKSQLVEQLATANHDLIATRDALWGEMQLAQKLQTVMVPRRPVLPGYEISTYMRVADEVGGDYYDVIEAGGRNWLVIGDVSGHGVSAGLVMMMAQAAIRTALSLQPDLPPSELLVVVNRLIYQNLRALGEDKYMTLSVLSEVQNGKFDFAGLHQDMFLFRAASGMLETIETRGIWMGLVDDVAELNEDRHFQMERDDVLVLYTDGLTEAHDDQDKMFSASKLKEELQKSCGKSSPKEVQEALIASLEAYNTDDDVTMVIIKRTALG